MKLRFHSARTRRFWVLLGLAAMFYFFANQTQVGWLYVVTALLVGVVLAARIMNRRSLANLSLSRRLEGAAAELWEGETVSIHLELNQSGNTIFQTTVREQCPLADPYGGLADQRYFLPQLSANASQIISYELNIYRRGAYRFPNIELENRAPFGIFCSRKTMSIETPLLVFPELQRIERLHLLERHPSPQLARSRPGWGSEVLGVRPYQTGDSPRLIHWRSVARTGQLFTKELADDSRPGLALLIDNTVPQFTVEPDYLRSKHNPFEMAIKIAASIGDYALRHAYPLQLMGEGAPRGLLTQDFFWHYLAKVKPDAMRPLGEQIRAIEQTFVAIILANPNEDNIAAIVELARRGHQLLLVLIEGQTFPGHQSWPLMPNPTAANIPNCEIMRLSYGDSWTDLLAGGPSHTHHA